MDVLTAIVLGIIQGLTEFLPVSSSGHLVIFQKWLGIQEHNLAFDVVVHVGTLFSVLTFYRRIIFKITKDILNPVHWKNRTGGVHLLGAVVVATIPTAVIGVLFRHQFKMIFSNINVVGALMIVTGGVLFSTRFLGKKKFEGVGDFSVLPQLNWGKAFIIGVCQSLAIAPGISRSGMTIVGAMALGEAGKNAALFSFLIAIPAILGATVLELKDFVWTSSSLSYLVAGFLCSYFMGLLGLWATIRAVGRGRLEYFAFYMWCIGLLALLS